MHCTVNPQMFRPGRALWRWVGVFLLWGILICQVGCRHAPRTTAFHAVRRHAPLDSMLWVDQGPLWGLHADEGLCEHCNPYHKTPDPADFTASFYSDNYCTAELIGTNVLLTASHCVDDQGSILIDAQLFAPGEDPYKGICTQAPDYNNNDIALCALEAEPPEITHETVSFGNQPSSIGQQLLLTGFGCCSQYQDGGLNYVPVLSVGLGTVFSLPAEGTSEFTTKGGASNCEGDSGSGIFVVDSTANIAHGSSGAFQRRVIVGVAKKVDHGTKPFQSSFTSTSAPAVHDFFIKWQARNQLKICGLATDAERCRDLPQN